MASTKSDFPALPGFYKTLFLYLEPISTTIPGLMILFYPGAAWFHHQLIPSNIEPFPKGSLDDRTNMAVWQLAGCYFLLGMISSFVFRAARDAFKENPKTQERIVGSLLIPLAIADVVHIASSFIGLPAHLRFAVHEWNPTTHGNITITTFLFLVRLAWFLGIGRERYYYGQAAVKSKRK